MDEAYEDIRKAVLEAALPEIAFDGWSEDVLARAGEVAGIDKNSCIWLSPAELEI